ncbi:hypothetical protein BV898_09495 [Hypsibius exemplaris]|uniref:G-protein coupled receptors family 1 profile domain-containing protein n=1 Tax=Hypsibius exemplaris TaxID=2072580 RepID=A0A1W0WMA6_HYPEX|nr:hypothetical protein BV898_09495 [Hypsibius exemplaris]
MNNNESHNSKLNFTSLLATRPAVNCSLSATQDLQLNGVPTILVFSQILGQIFNLVVFHLWRNKEPFLTLHVALAYGNIFTGAVGSISAFARWSKWTITAETIVKVQVALFAFSNRSTVVNTVLISLDRWLSVEFPIAYRNRISKRKLSIAVLVGWIYSMAVTAPPFVAFRDRILVGCSRPGTFDYTPSTLWEYFLTAFTKAPIYVALLFLFQLRILVIAVETRIRLIRLKRSVRSAPPPNQAPNMTHALRAQEAKLAARIVWSNLLGSMTVVLVTAISIVPTLVLEYNGLMGHKGTLLMQHIGSNLFVVQRIYTPFAYLAFFPQFRAAAVRPLVAMARRCGWVPAASRGATNSIGLAPVS